MPHRQGARAQMVADLEVFDQQYGEVPPAMMERAASGQLTIEELTDYEEAHGIVPGLILIGSHYVHDSFMTDGRVALARDPALDPERRGQALQTYDSWTRLKL